MNGLPFFRAPLYLPEHHKKHVKLDIAPLQRTSLAVDLRTPTLPANVFSRTARAISALANSDSKSQDKRCTGQAFPLPPCSSTGGRRSNFYEHAKGGGQICIGGWDPLLHGECLLCSPAWTVVA